MLALLQAHAVRAQAFDPCAKMVEAANGPGTAAIWNIRSLFAEPDRSPDIGFPEVHSGYFTVRPGRFANVTCNDDEYELQEMYPIGIVVRPLYRLSLPAYVNSGKGTPILVLTEYGQRKIVAESDLAPIEDGRSYVFADSAGKAMICKDAAACPGNFPDICGDACRYDISAAYGYAVTDSRQPEVAKVLDAFRVVLRDSLAPPEKDLRRRDEAKAAVCTPIAVQAFLTGGQQAQPRDSFLTLCSVRADVAGATPDAVAPLKIVDAAYAERHFGDEMNGSFHRRFGKKDGAGGGFLGSLTQKKDCGVEVTDVRAFEAGGGLGLKIPAGILEISADANVALNREITRTVGKDDYLLYSTYFIERIPGAGAGDPSDDLWMFSIAFRSSCEGGVASRPTSLTIYFDPLPSGSLEIGVKAELFKGYMADWENASYSASHETSYLKNGLFWRIKDQIAYFNWRDTIRRYIEEMPDTRELLDRQPEADRPMIRDFFVFLMLTAAYDYRLPSN